MQRKCFSCATRIHSLHSPPLTHVYISLAFHICAMVHLYYSNESTNPQNQMLYNWDLISSLYLYDTVSGGISAAQEEHVADLPPMYVSLSFFLYTCAYVWMSTAQTEGCAQTYMLVYRLYLWHYDRDNLSYTDSRSPNNFLIFVSPFFLWTKHLFLCVVLHSPQIYSSTGVALDTLELTAQPLVSNV